MMLTKTLLADELSRLRGLLLQARYGNRATDLTCEEIERLLGCLAAAQRGLKVEAR